VLESTLWNDEIPDSVFDDVYGSLSDFIRENWYGPMMHVPWRTSTTHLKFTDNLLTFHPQPVSATFFGEAEVHAVDDSPSRLILNSVYNYISFIDQTVSITEFKVKAPTSSGILIRAYLNGLPIWFRMVKSGSIQDIAWPTSTEDDPSIQGIDYIEIIGPGAEVHSLVLSLPFGVSDEIPLEYLYLQSDLERQVPVSGEFDPSAYVVDLETAVRTGLKFRHPSRISSLGDVRDDPIFSFDSFLRRVKQTEYTVPVAKIDAFIKSIESETPKPKTLEDFHKGFTERLLESDPDIVAFLLQSRESIVPYSGHNGKVITEVTEQQNQDQKHLIRFVPTIPETEPLVDVGNSVVGALVDVVGETTLMEIVKRKKISRLLSDEHYESHSLGDVDEKILGDLITSVLKVPQDDGMPPESRKQILVEAISLLVPNTADMAEVGTLVGILLA